MNENKCGSTSVESIVAPERTVSVNLLNLRECIAQAQAQAKHLKERLSPISKPVPEPMCKEACGIMMSQSQVAQDIENLSYLVNALTTELLSINQTLDL